MSGDDDVVVGANINNLGASLLITSSRYIKIWHRTTKYIGILIYLKKSTPYTALPPARSKSYHEIEIASDIDQEEKVEHDGPLCSPLSDQHPEEGLVGNGNDKVLPGYDGTSFTKCLSNCFKRNNYAISVLLCSAGLSFATEFKQEGPKYGWHDGVAIIIAVILIVAFPSITNYWRERKMMKLSKRKEKMIFTVEREGLLERRIEKPICYIDIFVLLVSALVALVVLIRLICKSNGDSGDLPELKGNVSVGLVMEVLQRNFLRPYGRISILTGLVTVVVLCVQHGVPLMVTVSLYYQKVVSRKDAVINGLSACTTMGLVTVICIDVSGGLTSELMKVSRVWMGEKDISKVEESEVNQVVLSMLQHGVVLSVAPELQLSPISSSLISWAETTSGMNREYFTTNFDTLEHRKLDSDKEGSGVLLKKVGENDQNLHLHWSGDASAVLDMCSLYYDSKGECHTIGNQKIKFEEVIKEMENSGLKPIAFAHKQTTVQELEHDELILLGLMGLERTCQESRKLAMEELREAGLKIILVSEDAIVVVKDIAQELGFELTLADLFLEGKVLQDLNESARLDKVDLALIMGSFCLEDKILMVQCLQEKGHVVAFVGKRTTSYSSVLQVADVGIIHDSLGTVVDTDSSGITIRCFSALKPIVMAGRNNYRNIQKFIQLQLTFSISGSLITLITTISTGESPLTAFQFVWVNFVMCLLGGLMMIMELSCEEKLLAIQSSRSQSVITREILKSISVQVLYQTWVSMLLKFSGHRTNEEKEVRKTMIFNSFLFCQVFNLLNTMNLLKKQVAKVVLKSYFFLVALAFCILVQVLMIEYAKCLAYYCMRLNVPHWAICVLVGFSSCAFEWILKNLVVILSTNNASETSTSPSVLFNWSRWFYLPLGFPFLMLLFFPDQMKQILR
ncbi:putative calcium-transporting ATPase 13, plasma membrane-type isoform X1 [Arachis duranensis]|uniref:Calcium-transporting ATPase 13, plasma membrane-type isoform X1 n=1 Tax=Arachis duranensis TaxID=130453 RepID=A0A6P4DYD0_ARADU|nr:putative calcium-transporting ATPase 13, plasma membrane-type isoform X1 [Arachis duranensis]